MSEKADEQDVRPAATSARPRWLPLALAALLMVILLAIAVITERGWGQPVQKPAGGPQSHITAGNEALNAGDLVRAIEQLEMAVQLAPDNRDAHFLLGNAYTQHGDLEKATQAYQRVLELNPDDVDAHANLGVVYYRMMRLNDAIAQFQAGLTIRPDDAPLHYLMGAAQLQMGDMVAARQSFEKAKSLNPNLPEVYFGLGMLNKLENRRDEAIANFEYFLKIGPGQDPQAKGEAEKQLNELKGQ